VISVETAEIDYPFDTKSIEKKEKVFYIVAIHEYWRANTVFR
jgi:hypothetical protein